MLGNSLPNNEKSRLQAAVQESNVSLIADGILNCKSLSKAIWEKKIQGIRETILKLTKKRSQSLLGSNDVENIMSFNWMKVIKEIHDNCPELLDIFVTVGSHDQPRDEESEMMLARRIGMSYGLLMQARCRDLSLVQRMLTVVLTEGGATKKVKNLRTS